MVQEVVVSYTNQITYIEKYIEQISDEKPFGQP
jgi:hypothetical protein